MTLHLTYIADPPPNNPYDWRPLEPTECAVCGVDVNRGDVMSGSMHLYHHLGLDAQSLETIAASVADHLRPLIEAIPQTDADAIATAVVAKLQPILDHVSQLEELMSDAISQINDAITRIANDANTIRLDIDAIVQRLQPNQPVPQDVLDSLRSAVDGLDSVVTSLNDVAQPPQPGPEA